MAALLGQVLSELRYPAQRWQILAEAEHWGVSPALRFRLTGLPERRYVELSDVLTALTPQSSPRAQTETLAVLRELRARR
ncbi:MULTISPECIES: DUF2795 domain-containing protein [unclassified Pseudonocardia]|uniref:DUF2795 domain-containing protein n=1 Tax=Pseudonocardia sp. P1 TaxID=761194 RepID=UPI00095EF4E9|nr:hypothetical protein Ae707Ps1_5890 [Pseudonocardia sp. Ae707_Ps1]